MSGVKKIETKTESIESAFRHGAIDRDEQEWR